MQPWLQENSLRATWLTDLFILQLPFQVANDYCDFYVKITKFVFLFYIGFRKVLWKQVEIIVLIFSIGFAFHFGVFLLLLSLITLSCPRT